MEEYDMMVKVIIIGDSGVGKTNIMSKFLKNKFMEESKATVGVEFGSKLFDLNGHKIKAQIWDTAGQEKYRALAKVFYKNAAVCILVYNIINKKSFDELKNYWINEIKANASPNLCN